MDIFPKNFCVAPFIQCTTHPNTSFSPCPYLGGTTWDGDKQNIMSQWTGNDLQKLRQQFIDDQRPTICQRCWHEEDNHKRSLRQRLFDPIDGTSDFAVLNRPNISEQLRSRIATQEYLKGPEILTIKNGNICNARCRTCHPGDSSRWIGDAKKLANITGTTIYATDQREVNWSDAQLAEILAISRNLKRLELFGGEPMYNKKVHALLLDIVKSGDSSHITLYVNTNGSVDIVEKLPFIKEFQQVEIGVSIDGVDQQFDYIRNGLDYRVIEKNISRWQEFFHKSGIVYSIDAISTVEILNVYYLPELKDRITKILPLAPFWNLLVDPAYLFIKNMPDRVKEHVIHKLQDDAEFSDLINVIKQPWDSREWQRFLEMTKLLDGVRGESFDSTFPEFSAIISGQSDIAD